MLPHVGVEPHNETKKVLFDAVYSTICCITYYNILYIWYYML